MTKAPKTEKKQQRQSDFFKNNYQRIMKKNVLLIIIFIITFLLLSCKANRKTKKSEYENLPRVEEKANSKDVETLINQFHTIQEEKKSLENKILEQRSMLEVKESNLRELTQRLSKAMDEITLLKTPPIQNDTNLWDFFVSYMVLVSILSSIPIIWQFVPGCNRNSELDQTESDSYRTSEKKSGVVVRNEEGKRRKLEVTKEIQRNTTNGSTSEERIILQERNNAQLIRDVPKLTRSVSVLILENRGMIKKLEEMIEQDAVRRTNEWDSWFIPLFQKLSLPVVGIVWFIMLKHNLTLAYDTLILDIEHQLSQNLSFGFLAAPFFTTLQYIVPGLSKLATTVIAFMLALTFGSSSIYLILILLFLFTPCTFFVWILGAAFFCGLEWFTYHIFISDQYKGTRREQNLKSFRLALLAFIAFWCVVMLPFAMLILYFSPLNPLGDSICNYFPRLI